MSGSPAGGSNGTVVLTLVAAFFLGTCRDAELQRQTQAPPPLDTASLFADVAFLAHDSLAGRATGSEGNRAARDWIAARFEALGLGRFADGFAAPFSFSGRDGGGVDGVNVVGYVPGSGGDSLYIVVTAHFDHLGVRNGQVYNGADDNASGTAALLALARSFAASPPTHPMVFAALDAEEMGLQGARAFVSNPPVPLGRIALNVNLDMISHSDSVLYVAGTYHAPYLRASLDPVIAESKIVLRYGHDSPNLPRGDDWTNASDHGPFHRLGIPFVYFGVEDHEDYHQATDDVETVNRSFYVEAVETIRLALVSLDEDLADIAARVRGM